MLCRRDRSRKACVEEPSRPVADILTRSVASVILTGLPNRATHPSTPKALSRKETADPIKVVEKQSKGPQPSKIRGEFCSRLRLEVRRFRHQLLDKPQSRSVPMPNILIPARLIAVVTRPRPEFKCIGRAKVRSFKNFCLMLVYQAFAAQRFSSAAAFQRHEAAVPARHAFLKSRSQKAIPG